MNLSTGFTDFDFLSNVERDFQLDIKVERDFSLPIKVERDFFQFFQFGMEFTLSVLIEATGYHKGSRNRLFKRLVKQFPEYIIKSQHSSRGRRCNPYELWFTAEGYREILKYELKMKTKKDLNKGQIYGFELLLHPGHYKFGKTVSWTQRKRGYRGHHTIGKMVILENVVDLNMAEAELLEYMRGFMKPEIGREWFSTNIEFEEVKIIVTKWLRRTQSEHPHIFCGRSDRSLDASLIQLHSIQSLMKGNTEMG